MEIWLKQGTDSIQLPVLPRGYEFIDSFQNTAVNISNYGEVNIIGKRKLGTTSISSFFPNRKYGFLQYGDVRKPYDYVKIIKDWMKEPVRLTITGTDINTLVTIESFSHEEKDSTGDVYYSLECKEYRIPKLTVKKSPAKPKEKIQVPETQREIKKVTSTEYVVKKGDTLSQIAKTLTGSAANYIAIAKQNNIANPNLIYPGQKLVVSV